MSEYNNMSQLKDLNVKMSDENTVCKADSDNGQQVADTASDNGQQVADTASDNGQQGADTDADNGQQGADTTSESNQTAATVKIQMNYNESLTTYKMERSKRMSKLFSTFCRSNFISPTSVRFLQDGRRLGNNDTPDSVQLSDSAVISVFTEQQGGAVAQGVVLIKDGGFDESEQETIMKITEQLCEDMDEISNMYESFEEDVLDYMFDGKDTSNTSNKKETKKKLKMLGDRIEESSEQAHVLLAMTMFGTENCDYKLISRKVTSVMLRSAKQRENWIKDEMENLKFKIADVRKEFFNIDEILNLQGLLDDAAEKSEWERHKIIEMIDSSVWMDMGLKIGQDMCSSIHKVFILHQNCDASKF